MHIEDVILGWGEWEHCTDSTELEQNTTKNTVYSESEHSYGQKS